MTRGEEFMPRKSAKVQSDIDATNEKRSLIDSLELLRGSNTTTTEKTVPPQPHFSDYSFNETAPANPTSSLEREVRKLQSANILLESDLKNMEQKALDAIAESGELRHQLDISRDNTSANENQYYTEERQAILDELRNSRYTHEMLTEAINESQNEITRLTKTIEKITLKLLAA